MPTDTCREGSMAQVDGLPDRIGESLNGKTVLLTGGTGFMGKIVVEKMLRMSPGIKQLILIVRKKKGKEPRERLQDLFQCIIFERMIKDRGMEFLTSRTTVVSGDMAAPDLALSIQDRLICSTANVIIHCAANVRFDQGLKEMVFLNTRATKLMLELAKECTNLQLFIHVSTAYCHPDVKVLKEIIYPPPADPEFILNLMETSTDDFIKEVTPKLLMSWPNTYVYSKALAETIVAGQMEELNVVILRPSVVIPVYRDPIPGWTDNINGPAGLLMAAGRGVLRTMYGNENTYADFIPVDIFANALMISIWYFLENENASQRIFNLTTSDEIRVTWAEVLVIGRRLVHKIPLTNPVWYPGGSMTKYRLYHQIRAVLFHWIPAVIVDMILFFTGFKPVLIRVHKRIQKGMEVFEYYANNQWEFVSNAKDAARALLNEREKMAYLIDTEGFDIEQFFEIGALTCRRNLLKQSDESIPAAQKLNKLLWFLDMSIKVVFFGLLVYWLYGYLVSFGVIRTVRLPLETY